MLGNILAYRSRWSEEKKIREPVGRSTPWLDPATGRRAKPDRSLGSAFEGVYTTPTDGTATWLRFLGRSHLPRRARKRLPSRCMTVMRGGLPFGHGAAPLDISHLPIPAERSSAHVLQNASLTPVVTVCPPSS
jgi:hypothetical protein